MSKMKGWFFLNLSDLIYKCGKEGVYLHTYYIPINIVDTIFCLASICMQKYTNLSHEKPKFVFLNMEK